MPLTTADGAHGTYPLFEIAPALDRRLNRVPLGDYPTPVDRVDPTTLGLPPGGPQLFIKREDISAQGYGGNKVRPLELVLGDAQRRGARRIWATGALGSNHSVATAIHAHRAGLQAGALLWPQPVSLTARDNLETMLSLDCRVECLPGIAMVPLSVAAVRLLTGLRGPRDYVQAPGAAVPLGALGHLSAALELARQIRAGELQPPHDIVVGVGSTCTAAGLLVGLRLARYAGLAFTRGRLPIIHGVRVTPWPVTDRHRVVGLAYRTQELLARLGGPALSFSRRELSAGFRLHTSYLEAGYGRASAAGRDAITRFARRDVLQLDTTYSAKAAAFTLDLLASGRTRGPVLFWATKSSVPLPRADPSATARAPAWVQRWLSR